MSWFLNYAAEVLGVVAAIVFPVIGLVGAWLSVRKRDYDAWDVIFPAGVTIALAFGTALALIGLAKWVIGPDAKCAAWLGPPVYAQSTRLPPAPVIYGEFAR